MNALARRSAHIDARNILLDKHLSLLWDDVVINTAVIVKRRMSRCNKAFEFFNFHFFFPLLIHVKPRIGRKYDLLTNYIIP